MNRHFILKIFGQVQGVLFRQTARERARELGLVGFARNEPDGSVYVEVEGENENLELFHEWCRKGTSLAHVEKVDVETRSATKEFQDFEIK